MGMAFLLYWTFEPLNRIGMPTYKRNIYIYICESHHGSWTCLTFKENYVRRPCMLHVAMWCNPEIHLNFFMLRLCMLVKSRISFCTFPWRKELQVPLFYLTSITLRKVVKSPSTFSSLRRGPQAGPLLQKVFRFLDPDNNGTISRKAENSWIRKKKKKERKVFRCQIAMNFEVFFPFFFTCRFFFGRVWTETHGMFFLKQEG